MMSTVDPPVGAFVTSYATATLMLPSLSVATHVTSTALTPLIFFPLSTAARAAERRAVESTILAASSSETWVTSTRPLLASTRTWSEAIDRSASSSLSVEHSLAISEVDRLSVFFLRVVLDRCNGLLLLGRLSVRCLMGTQRECADTETSDEHDACGDRDDLLCARLGHRSTYPHTSYRKFLGEPGIVLTPRWGWDLSVSYRRCRKRRLVVHVHIIHLHILLMLSLVLHPGWMNWERCDLNDRLASFRTTTVLPVVATSFCDAGEIPFDL